MINRYQQLVKFKIHARKLFSEVIKRKIACKQKYTCVGEYCKGQKLLPEVWDLDHIVPLFQGGSNDESNLQIICGICHNLKTQNERVEFYKKEREAKYKNEVKFVLADDYYTKHPVTTQYFKEPRLTVPDNIIALRERRIASLLT